MKYIVTMLVTLVISKYTDKQMKTQDKMDIEKVLTDFTDNWNKHDATSFSLIFSEDADFTNIRGQHFSGRTEIAKHHATIFATRFKDSYLKITQSKVRFIKPDVVAVDAWWELTGIKVAEGKEISENGLMTFVMTQNSRKWLITVNHNMKH